MTPRIKKMAALLAAVLAVVIAIFVLRSSKEKSDDSPAVDATTTSGQDKPAMHRALPNIGTESVDATANERVECKLVPCAGPVCDKCSTENCPIATAGCQGLTDKADRRLCEKLYECYNDPKNHCTTPEGDVTRCWCGTNPTTCITDNDGPTKANGPCAALVLEAGKSKDAAEIRYRFSDPKYPLGLAANLTNCRGGFCAHECGIAPK